MRQRLAGTYPVKPLDEFASVLEPVKEYSRHAENYSSFTPLNRLVDSIAPESDSARDFRNAVDNYLAGPKQETDAEALRKQLAAWLENARAVRTTLENNSLLIEDVPIADSLARLCQAGQEALGSLNSHNTATADWKRRSSAIVGDAAKPQADMLIQIVPAIQKLVETVQTTQ